MQQTSYAVFLKLKIHWLTKTFYYLLIACLIILFLFEIYMLQSEHSSSEMRAAYFLLTTSEFEKTVFVFALWGAPTFFILYKFSRFKRQAHLTLFPDRIEVDNFKTITSFPIKEITRIACNDALTSDGFPMAKLTIDFKDKSKKITSMTLLDYSQSEELMNTLLGYENIEFHVTSLSFNPEVLDE